MYSDPKGFFSVLDAVYTKQGYHKEKSQSTNTNAYISGFVRQSDSFGEQSGIQRSIQEVHLFSIH